MPLCGPCGVFGILYAAWFSHVLGRHLSLVPTLRDRPSQKRMFLFFYSIVNPNRNSAASKIKLPITPKSIITLVLRPPIRIVA